MLASLCLQALILLVSVKQVTFKSIIPRPMKPVELDITNRGETGDYTFHFFLENDSLDGILA
jgi:hypothetical protein